MNPELIRRVSEDIAEIILRGIVLDDTYLVCTDTVHDYVSKRLLSGLPVEIVNQSGTMRNVPPRDLGIYKLHGEAMLPTHNSIHTGFAGDMVDAGAGVLVTGSDISVADLVASAKMEVYLRIQAAAEAEADKVLI